MNSKNQPKRFTTFTSYSLRFALAAVLLPSANAAQSLWNGGGADTNWSTATNWDFAPLNGDSLIFDGTTDLTNVNDFMTALDATGSDPAITFALGAGSFVINDDGVVAPIAIGSTEGDSTFVSQQSPNAQEIAHDVKFVGGSKLRNVSFLDPSPVEAPGTVAPGTLTISGNIDFTNDWLQLADNAGTLILSGNNVGVGAPNKVNGNGNNMRSTLLANSANSTLELGSPTALGATTTSLGTPGQLIGININQGTTVTSSLELTGENKVDNTIAYIQSMAFENPFDLEITGAINVATNGRGFSVNGTGNLIISGDGYYITSREAAQLGILQGNGGNIILDGKLHDTFQAGGITTLTQSVAGLAPSHFRKQGTNSLIINSDNSETFNGEMRHRDGTVVIGHEFALGPNGGPEVDLLANTFSGNTTLEMADAEDLIVGQMVTGAGIPVGATVIDVNRSGGPAVDTLVSTFAGDPTIDVADPTGIAVGRIVTGPGIPVGATVIDIDASILPALITLSEAATTDGTDVSVNFSGSPDLVELSEAATADATDVSLNFSGTPDLVFKRPTAVNGSNVITVPDASGIGIGYWVGARTFPGGTTVIAIDSTADPIEITLSNPSSADAAADRDAAFGRPGPSQVEGPATLDLNGHVIGEVFSSGFGGTIINSDPVNPAGLTKEITGSGNITVNGDGDLTINSYSQRYASVGRNLTKNGSGTLTLGGSTNNDRFGLIVNSGNVNLAKTAGTVAANNPLVMNAGAGTVKLTGNTNTAVNDSVQIVIDGGTFDLNGVDEICGGIEAAATGGTITNNGAGTATLTIGANSAATDRTFAGDIVAGTSTLNIVKGNAFVQTLSGANTYTGSTTVNNGTLSLTTAFLADGADVLIAEFDAFLDLPHALTDTVASLKIGGVSQPIGVYGAVGSGAQFEIAQITGTGFLNVTVAGSDYDSWATGFSLVGGATDDDDNDGISNEDEYAFGLNPSTGSSVNPVTQQLDQSTGVFKYTRRNSTVYSTGLTYTYGYSTTLDGTWTPFTPTSETSDDGDPTETITVTVPAGLLSNPKLFIQTTTD